jgi:hypothetical protein
MFFPSLTTVSPAGWTWWTTHPAEPEKPKELAVTVTVVPGEGLGQPAPQAPIISHMVF